MLKPRQKQQPDTPAVSETATEKAKRLEEYAASDPPQLTLFQLLDLKPQERPRYSHTIELYDFMPKYHWGKVQRINGKFLEVLEREFECRNIK